MTSAEIEARLLDVLATMLDVPRQTIRHDVSRTTLDAWDSLKHMQIVFAVEEKFCIRFTEAEIPRLDSYQQFAEHLRSRHAA